MASRSAAPVTPINLTIDPATNNAGGVAELIAAINTANTNAGADTINLFACGTYTFSAAHNYEFGPNALPIIRSDITIQGQGAKLVRSSAVNTPKFRFFYVAGSSVCGLSAGTLTLRDLSLQNGLANGGDSLRGGGGAGMGGDATTNHNGGGCQRRVHFAGLQSDRRRHGWHWLHRHGGSSRHVRQSDQCDARPAGR